jgi:CheY-like chemotaxis protein
LPEKNSRHGSRSSESRGRILVIEDNDEIRSVIGEILDFEGYAVRTASNGKEGMALFESEELPDLVILDLNMPVMTGEEVIKAMGEDERLSSIPIVVISAHLKSARGRSGRGVAALICKPFNMEDLLPVLERHVRPFS